MTYQRFGFGGPGTTSEIGTDVMRSPIRRYRGLGATEEVGFRYSAEALARANAALASGVGAVLVTFEMNGRNPIVEPFTTRSLASDAYSAKIDAPGKLVYAGVFDSGGAWNEWFGSTTTMFQTKTVVETLKNLAPVLLGVGVLIAGAVWLSRGEKRKGTPRRRRSPSWRRRVTTTWR
jgi:hypothetical protein